MKTLNLSGPVNQHLFRWNDSFAVAIGPRLLVTSAEVNSGLGTWQRIDSLGAPFPPMDLASIIVGQNGSEIFAANFNPVSVKADRGFLFVTLDREVDPNDIVRVAAYYPSHGDKVVWPQMDEDEDGLRVETGLWGSGETLAPLDGSSDSWVNGSPAFSSGKLVGVTRSSYTIGRAITLLKQSDLEPSTPPTDQQMTKALYDMGYQLDPVLPDMVTLGAISIPRFTPACDI